MARCDDCPLRGAGQVLHEGDITTAKYILVGEAPGRDEVRKGRPFVGATGRGLMRLLAAVDIKREDCYLTNAVKCKAPGNKVPAAALQACRPYLGHELSQAPSDKPFLLMGKTARDALLPDLSRQGMLRSVGWYRYDQRDVFCLVHPAYVILYNPNNVMLFLIGLQRFKRGKQAPLEVSVQVVRNLNQLLALKDTLQDLPDGTKVAFDLETCQVDHQRDRILCLAVGYAPGKAAIVPDELMYRDNAVFYTGTWDKDDWADYFALRPPLGPEQFEGGAHRVLTEMFALENVTWCGHNAKFDLRFLRGQVGVATARVDFDTIIAHYVLKETSPHDLKTLGDEWYDTGDYEGEVIAHAGKKSGRYSKVPRRILYKYSGWDVEITRRLAIDFEESMREKGLFDQPFMFPLMAAVPMLTTMELRGILIDWRGLTALDTDKIGPELERTTARLREITGDPDLNPRSSKRMIEVAYDELDFPVVKIRTRSAGRKQEKRSTQKEVVDKWVKMIEEGELHLGPDAVEFIKTLKWHRHVEKMRGSYVKKWERLAGPDGTVHPSYLLRGTVTGRLSAKDPPVQTIPSDPDDPFGQPIAAAHIARPGWWLVYADYSQMELRVAAAISQDPEMLQAFNKEDPDYHSDVARAAFGEGYSKFERDFCKRLTFGWLFGGDSYGIAKDALLFSDAVAKRFSTEWNSRYKVMTAWHKSQWALMRKQGYVENLLGRRRRFYLITKQNQKDARGAALNMPIQGVTSDMNLISAIKLHDMYAHTGLAYIWLLIHDALLMEVHESMLTEVAEAVPRVMVETAEHYFPSVKFAADALVGRNLGEMGAWGGLDDDS